MKYFLAKTEPSEYSIDDLKKDSQAEWDGVKNYQALQAIRDMKIGDLVLIYHSVINPGIVGLAQVTKEAFIDPKNPKSYIPTFRFIRKFDTPITLSEIKATNKFNDFALVRQSRLSTMVVPEKFTNWLISQGLNLKS